MLKKFLLCLALVIACASSAFGEPHLWSCHYSIAGLDGGHSNYSDARFFYVALTVDDNNQKATSQHVNLEGNMTISGGKYSFNYDQVCQAVSGGSRQFKLSADMKINENLEYALFDNNNKQIFFVESADNGLNNVNVSWNFPNMPSLNGQGVIPNFRTTQEQLNSFVPYVEYIRSGSAITGLRWRVVNPSDTSSPAVQNFNMKIRILNVYKTGYRKFYNGTWENINAGETPEGTITFDESINESELWRIIVRLSTHDDAEIYDWGFFNFSEPQPDIWMNHVTNAQLVNGKANYSNAEFMGLLLDPFDDTRLAEAKYFTDKGRITIPGGGCNVGFGLAGITIFFLLKKR